MMSQATKFVNVLLRRFTAISSSSSSSSSFSRLKHTASAFLLLPPKFYSLSPRAFISHSPLKFRFSGSYLASGSILGMSVASASVIAHAMDAGDALVDDSCNDSLEISEDEENVHHLWKLARKFWLPVFFFLTVLTNLDDPIAILFIKLCQQSMRQETRFLKVKSLYASKVEVQDYELLCFAAVEVRGQKFTLVGILGTWWTLPRLPSWEGFSFVRNRLGSILVKTT